MHDLRHKILPPGDHLLVPMSSRSAAKAGLSLFPACRKRSLLTLRAAWFIVSVFGAQGLPTKAVEWEPPIDASSWNALVDRWTTEIGPFDDLAIHLRRPARRAGASILLLNSGAPTAFVKVRPEREGLEQERWALDALERFRPQTFTAPRVLASGTQGIWNYLAMTPFAPQIHTMIRQPDLEAILDEFQAISDDVLQRPPTVGADWHLLHGDLTPWNLRSFARGKAVLFDWEDASWAPPNADAVWYDHVVARLGIAVAPSGIPHSQAAVEYWRTRLTATVAPGERSLAASVLRELEARIPAGG